MLDLSITALIPHREPFLFLRSARAVSAEAGSGVASWPAGHPIFRGHFPGLPIVPGVCQVEAAAQLAAAVAAAGSGRTGDDAQHVGVLGGVRRTLLHAPLFPDQELELELELRPGLGPMALCRGTGRRGDTRIITFELMLAVASRREFENGLPMQMEVAE